MPKFNVEQLKDETKRKNYTEEIKKELNANKSRGIRHWESIRDTIIKVAKKRDVRENYLRSNTPEAKKLFV